MYELARDRAQEVGIVEMEHGQEELSNWLVEAMGVREDSERYIVRERKLIEAPRTLESLGEELGLSKERIRQVEAAAFKKMRLALENQAPEASAFFQ